MNFKGVQTFGGGESGKFFKILTFQDLHEYEFILTHLYAKFESSFTIGE
jgi:hypothetical protein